MYYVYHFEKYFCLLVILSRRQTILISKMNSSVTRQKGEFQDGCFSGCESLRFFGKFGVLCFVTSVLRFVLFPYYRRTVSYHYLIDQVALSIWFLSHRSRVHEHPLTWAKHSLKYFMLTFYALTPQNGQTHINNSPSVADKLFECV